MLDFYKISTHMKSNGVVEVYPKFLVGKREDLMVRGGDFYAVWIDEKKLWSRDEDDVNRIIDRDLDIYVEQHKDRFPNGYSIKYMWDADSGSIDRWHKYVKQQQRDNYANLDDRLTFQNQETTRKDYASKRLPYALKEGEYKAYDKMMSVLYSPEERMKLEWAIGAVVTGDSTTIQKFIVLYGDRGTGKSTVINIMEDLFEGYTAPFDAKTLGSANAQFALEAFKDDPLVAIQHDGNLSKIEDNTRLNSLVSHERMTVNVKHQNLYSSSFKTFLVMASNDPVKITNSKSGILRRLIDVTPTGNKIPRKEYDRLKKEIKFELGAIAYHCKEVYLANKSKYDDYIPLNMMGATNDFYNFMLANYYQFEKEDGVSQKVAWEMYKAYNEEANVPEYARYSLRLFKEELKSYFREYTERYVAEDGTRLRSYYEGFKKDRFVSSDGAPEEPEQESWIIFKEQPSRLDEFFKDSPAQYAFIDEESGSDRPERKWVNCKTKLKDLDTSKLHYILQTGHEDIIRMDFDKKGPDGKKNLELNKAAASKLPKTYAEVSKSGGGIHLYYIYQGDVSKLSGVYDTDVEIKVASGNSGIRRKLTLCNDIPIATISSGLPLKGDDKKKMVDVNAIYTDKQLHNFIKRALKKEHPPNHTITEVSLIHDVLERHYKAKVPYDVSDMAGAVYSFASSASNSSKQALSIYRDIKFKSEEAEKDPVDQKLSTDDRPITIFDIEVFPNLIIICWKYLGKENKVNRLINPTAEQAMLLLEKKLVGFNCRRYDNHILYYIAIGKTIPEVYDISRRIISKDNQAFSREAYDASYMDLFDLASKKQSLKKWEIELGEIHKELGMKWDQPVPEDRWDEVARYCDNDVLATEAVYNHLTSDILAREILADLTGMIVNSTTNTLTTKLIFGSVKDPQSAFNYRNLALPVEGKEPYEDWPFKAYDGQKSMKPFFPGYTYDKGKSIYRGEEVGEGGYVYAEPGIYENVALLDIASMHPSSIIAEKLFGHYTDIFEELVQARVYLKHAVAAHKKGDTASYENNLALVRSLVHLGDKFARYLSDYEKLENLPQALKIAINSVYGLTAASFKNPFRDPRNIDNIVAKRGALFMVDLKHAVQEKGFTVAHIKTDSIKIPNATPEIIEFVMNFGKMYGYNFELEDTYDKMALVNNAVYIAKYKEPHKDKKTGKDIWWTATGTQFQVPFVFKRLFSKEEVVFKDLCETKSSTTGSLYLDFNEDLPEGEHNRVFVGKVGQFCPMVEGSGGGELTWEKNDNYNAVSGTKGWRWKESEIVKNLGQENLIDRAYYVFLCEDAVKTINEAGAPFGKDYNYLVKDNPCDDDILPF